MRAQYPAHGDCLGAFGKVQCRRDRVTTGAGDEAIHLRGYLIIRALVWSGSNRYEQSVRFEGNRGPSQGRRAEGETIGHQVDAT